LILLALGVAAAFAPHSTGVSVQWPNSAHAQKPSVPPEGFGRLPLSFEPNQGQTDSRVRFLARGHGYGIFLTDDGASFSFSDSSTPLHMRLQDAATSPRITGVEQLPGKVNYLVGNDSNNWRTNIPTYEHVRYEQIYNGVDLVYYGNQRQLEYDFIIAPGASFKQIRLAFDGAGKLKLNRRGDLVLNSGTRKITLLRPKAYQEINDKRREVSVRYSLKPRGEVTFKVGNYDKSQPLVIDPLLVYSTFLGGSGQDMGNSIAADASGNVYVAGQTASLNFPTSAPFDSVISGITDAFVAKLNANGSALIYSTFLGGNDIDNATSIAVDNAGNVYLTGETSSADFPVLNALHPTLTGLSDAFVSELNSAGSGLVYSTYLGGHSSDFGNSIAIDNSGNAYVTGNTSSADFPTTNPFQATRLGHAIFKTTNAAGNWTPSDSGLAASLVIDLVLQPGNSAIVYAATETGLFKSTDSGANWSSLPGTLPFVTKLALDPINPAIIYAATNAGVFKSTDGGNSFTLSNNGIGTSVRTIVVNPVTPTTLYATVGGTPFFKSVDGGATWNINLIPSSDRVDSLTIDPNTPNVLYADTQQGIFKSTDSGSSWTKLNTGIPSFLSVNSITIDPVNNLLYAATTFGVWISADAGTTWFNISGNLSFDILKVAVDPTNPSVLYAATAILILKTTDRGANWTESVNGYPRTRISSVVLNPTQPSTLFIGTTSTSDAFVTKLSAGGVSQIYSTFLGGNLLDQGNGITLDASGNAYVTGFTSSVDFPTANAIQANRGDNFISAGDAFITKLNASGSALVYSTYLGADFNDAGRAIAVDTNGNAYVCGSTGSQSFPTVNAFQSHNASLFNDVFVTKVNAAGSALIYSTYLGGDSTDDCEDIAIDSAGSAYVTGLTTSSDFPLLASLQATGGGASHDAFITKLAPNGSSLIHSTYFGGSNNDGGRGITVDSLQNIYVVGTTNSTNFPTQNPLQPGFGGGSDVFIAKLRPAPDLVVTMSDSPDPVTFGSNLTYTITVTNIGEVTATGVTLTDTLPAGATLVSANSTAGTCSGTTTITCGLGTLSGGSTVTVTIVVTPPVGTITNTATATLNEADAVPANNTATVETLVDSVDLTITKKAAQNLVAPGSILTFSLVVKNKSAVPANVTVTDNFPAELTLINCTSTGNGVCGGSASNVSVSFSQLAAGASEAILLTVRVSPSATEGTVISNTASVSSPVLDPDTSNNSSTASVTVAAVPILQKSNGLIAFEREFFTLVQETSGIYTAKSDLTDEKLFPGVPTNSGAGIPEWSPDGSRLAFQVFNSSSGLNEIKVINADGTGLMKLVDNASERNRGITWSPNGSQIAYIGSGGPSEDTVHTIHIANADGSGNYRLPGSPAFLWAVDWSPDGTKFVYSDAEELFVINIDGTGKQQLTTVQPTPSGSTADFDPRWSPDGTQILFTRYRDSVFGNTYLMNADGSNQRKLFNFNSYSPHWSPDGRSVVLMSQFEKICTVNLDNTDLKCPNANNFSFFDITPSWQRLPNPNPTPTPTPVPTFSLSGKLTFNTAPAFAEVELSGPVHARIVADVNGNYEFVNLPAGQYTVTPLNIAYDFVPANRTVTITNANVTGQDFAGTFVTFTISGHIKDNNGNPLPGIKITIGSPGAQGFILSTDVNGFYSVTLQRGGTYSLTPDSITPYDILPRNKIIENLAANEVVDFVGMIVPTKVIAGRVVEAISGQGIEGARVILSQGDAGSALTFTDANGNFTFGGRKMNQHYDVSVLDTQTFIFEPRLNFPGNDSALIFIPSLTTDQNLTFTGSKRNTVQVTSATAAVNEGSGFIEIVVTRSGDRSSPARVNFATADTAGLAACSVVNGKASERCDYGSTAGTLRFGTGEDHKSIFVPIINDANVEGNETFTFALSGPIGAQLSSTANVTVTIIDNDTTPATQNPIDGVEPFVTQQYIDFLGRLPDTVGFANWVATLNGCPNGGFGENDNPSCDRVHVSAGFFLSDEFRGRGYWAYRFYEVGFDRRPLYAEFVPDMGQVGGSQSPQSELLSKALYTDAFVTRSEFTNRYNGLSNSAYVNALEQNAEITLGNKADLIAALDGNQKTRGQVLREIVESKAVEDKFFIRAFVAMQYFGYLRRDPDTVGYNNWVTTLTNDPSNFRHMIFGFLFSNEYRGRFGP
jgi:uncharacterized repeat protein (TIGR01451 family)